MSSITIEMPDDIRKIMRLSKSNQKLQITDFFSRLWLDIDFILKEKKYQKKFLTDLEKWDFSVSEKF